MEQYKSVVTFMSVRNICLSHARYHPVKAEAFKTLLKYDNHTENLAKTLKNVCKMYGSGLHLNFVEHKRHFEEPFNSFFDRFEKCNESCYFGPH